MSETRRPNWAEMTREDFAAGPEPKPAPPGQMPLFTAEPGMARARAKTHRPADCPAGTPQLPGFPGSTS